MARSLPTPSAPAPDQTRGVMAVPAFRKLWRSMAFSSLGDWLGLLATTAMAQQLSSGNYSRANFAIAGVFIARLLPSVFLGPLAGVIADRFDRRRLMVVTDIFRAAFYISIPIVGTFLWLYIATIAVECLTLFWSPAKEASVPNLVPKDKLESANQVSLLAAYGTAPIAAALFSLLALISGSLAGTVPFFATNSVDLALYINAASFAFGAWTVWGLHEIPKGAASKVDGDVGVAKSLLEGWRFVSTSKIVRGLIVGMVGAFIAAGAVIGLARTFVGDLGAGDAAYGVLFGSVFTGLAGGIAFGPKVFEQFSRRRLFGAALTAAGLFLVLLAAIPNLVIAVFVTILLGAFSGICWVTGFTMLGMEVQDEVRGRTFAFMQSLIRVTLVAVLAISPLIAAAVGKHTFKFQNTQVSYNGAAITILIAGIIATLIGVVSYRQMKDRPNVSFWSDISNALKGELGSITGAPAKGLFIAFEGGEGSGKSTQTKLLKKWLEDREHGVVLSREPGGTPLGNDLREILLSHRTGVISPRAEALLYAADRAHHVYSVIRPALEAGDVVITDRYFDSSIAYQGAGRILEPGEVARISRWATESLFPTLTIILDLPAEIGLGRLKKFDRLESEPLAFHERIRQEYLQLALLDPERYLVVDGQMSVDEIHGAIVTRVSELPALSKVPKKEKKKVNLRPDPRKVIAKVKAKTSKKK
ncbi:MAG: dTMP kinase [Actinobacteria bacterium]|uniref:dTMP kinase n=1 Tax=freshwater metagenome TaxID=449393 RepID=A0A6J7D3L8_9ZZZZ|nr:dTMP kinase [Actinomycetota bacterium]MSX24724.1 dTMP kinase [Actinomycetota bacterium]MSY45906.1 dTMP kinase [Actinomycetota bacterium]MSY56868.1 dTMP kinase [Actinomycetota bacterium]MTB00543.1 dTMP kinase [Actinomycetota bacterium]